MGGPIYFFILVFVLLICTIHLTQGKGGRGGGGSRGGGSRGGSSSGSRGSSSSGSGGSSTSRGSSSSSSSSSGSSSSGTQWDRSGSRGSNKPSPPKSSVNLPKPSAPELPRQNPSAPKPPGHSQPSNPYSYNPNFPQSPDSGRVNPPSYGSAASGNLPPYSPRENPPPYSPGNPPPYAPGIRQPYPPGNNLAVNPPAYGSGPPGNPPPYGSGPLGNLPPYAPGSRQPYPPGNNPLVNQPPYGSGPPGNVPPNAPPPYGVNIPQGPSYGQPSYGGINRPNLPQGNPPPYGVNPVPSGHGIPHGNIPHGGQPSNFPYPRQPGMSYPSSGSSWSNYYPPGGPPSVKPHKKKGILGGLFSLGKKPKHPGISSHLGSFGSPYGGPRISPINMMIPLAAVKKPHKPFHFKHHYWVLPYVAHRRKWGGIDFDYDDDDDYVRRRCFRPRPPVGGSIRCEYTLQKLVCIANCPDGYTFPDNTTELEALCWRFSGHWSRSRFLPRCQPFCKPEDCQNGGTCTAPGQCRCSSEYRGDHCEHHILNCDILKFAKGSKISWVCSHSRNETVCNVKCRPPLVFETPAAEQYHCHLNGTWTPDHIPQCVQVVQTTEGTPATTLLTEASQEG